ncbi:MULTISPECIES: lipopolysaccharide heptosyltransferase II [unclassified Agarivorans]|uniref:lipopolysaccharide heptosyltransferase II n=1 Tax=unclassified Agarivorans TaxID=2636026 RepID=UPI0026E155EC|nr:MULTISPECIES: lipopolysaccharide heptosyltransferase II [unclassified Agarivorans]MDO6685724.1 lipopolysaccharide heptosyltransferase II [Agarivorans sp. 3_MG-2023]MDO6716161.1 lipopolysaccharide heptosyltransferase II [Agarivorans sp. 2_MG-2023]
MKILVVGPSWVGDMVMSQSLYKALKQLHPQAQLDVLAPDWCRPMLERMPEVDNALRMPLGHGDLQLAVRWKLAKQLKQSHYDWAITQPNSLKAALIPWFAGIKQRTGWKGESRYGLLNDLRSNKQAFPLMVERYVSLAHPKSNMTSAEALPSYGHPALAANINNQQQALAQLKLNTQQPILALCPGAEFGPAKRWPEQHYAQVAAHWIEQYQGQAWIFGSDKDQTVGEQIIEHLPKALQSHCHNLAGKTKLAEAIDLMALAKLAVSNDSGLMHIAAALQLPLIAVYGSSSPQYTPPLTDKAEILHTDIECRPCFKKTCQFGHLKCLTELAPERAISAIAKLLN